MVQSLLSSGGCWNLATVWYIVIVVIDGRLMDLFALAGALSDLSKLSDLLVVPALSGLWWISFEIVPVLALVVLLVLWDRVLDLIKLQYEI